MAKKCCGMCSEWGKDIVRIIDEREYHVCSFQSSFYSIMLTISDQGEFCKHFKLKSFPAPNVVQGWILYKDDILTGVYKRDSNSSFAAEFEINKILKENIDANPNSKFIAVPIQFVGKDIYAEAVKEIKYKIEEKPR